jgi:hypothetical protein
MANFWVNGIVSARDKQPYVQLSNEHGMIAQLSMGEARQIASDILLMTSRTEADAMLLTFFSKMELPENLPAHFMQAFRDYRAEIDQEKVERSLEGGDDSTT